MKPKEYEVIYKLTVDPTVPFPSTLNWNTERVGELIRCKDCRYFAENDMCVAWHQYTVKHGFCHWAERREEKDGE